MGKRREVSKMLEVSDGYWGFVNKKRFFRFVYASLTFFAILALVATFFQVGSGTSFAPEYLNKKLQLSNAEMEENERMLRYIYVFYPTPLMAAWFVVYFAKFFFCWRIKRLRKARNYRYNLLLATITMAVLYGLLFALVLKMDLIDGPRFRAAMITFVCEFSLIGIEVFDMHKERKARHERKRLLQKQREAEAEVRRQLESGETVEEGRANDPSPVPFRGPRSIKQGGLV